MNLKGFLIKAIIPLFITVLFLGLPDKVGATEGTVELESQTDEPTRCFAASLRMQNQDYRILFSCRYIIYPVDESVFNYVVWATPTDGGNPIRLGVLGLGKGELKTKTSFDSLFVTTESRKDVKTPSGNIVMQGDVESIEFLDSVEIPTPITPQDSDESQEVDNGDTDEEEETQKQQLTTREKLVLALKRAGIAALFALVILIGIIFVVSRSRG